MGLRARRAWGPKQGRSRGRGRGRRRGRRGLGRRGEGAGRRCAVSVGAAGADGAAVVTWARSPGRGPSSSECHRTEPRHSCPRDHSGRQGCDCRKPADSYPQASRRSSRQSNRRSSRQSNRRSKLRQRAGCSCRTSYGGTTRTARRDGARHRSNHRSNHHSNHHSRRLAKAPTAVAGSPTHVTAAVARRVAHGVAGGGHVGRVANRGGVAAAVATTIARAVAGRSIDRGHNSCGGSPVRSAPINITIVPCISYLPEAWRIGSRWREDRQPTKRCRLRPCPEFRASP